MDILYKDYSTMIVFMSNYEKQFITGAVIAVVIILIVMIFPSPWIKKGENDDDINLGI